MASGNPYGQRAATWNAAAGSRPSCTATIAASSMSMCPGNAESGPTAALDRSMLVSAALGFALTAPVDQALLALTHELLELRFELGVLLARPARRLGLPVRSSLFDREVDLPPVLDADDLDGHFVVLVQMVADAADEVPVYLRDVNQTGVTVLQCDERTVRG